MADIGGGGDASTFKGNDIDSDGDGSVNDADTLQGNQPGDLKEDIDNKTIVRNQNNELENQKRTEIIGDFENDSAGDWTKIEEGTSAYANPSDALSSEAVGNYVFYLMGDGDKTWTSGIKRTIDFSGLQEFKFKITDETISSMSGISFKLLIGGSTYINDGSPYVSEFTEDISNIEGEKEIVFKVESDGSGTDSSNFGVRIDYIRLFSPSIVEKTIDNGSGGT